MIRLAEIDDIPVIMDELLVPFHAENGLAPLNRDKTLQWATEMVSEGRVIAALQGGKIVGAIGMVEIPLKYADKSLLCDEFFYVKVEWRGESVGRELREAFTALATAGDQIGILTVFNPGRLAKRRRISDLVGFIPFGYMLRLA
jgi:N-acetylglutamate synthase-like GNAT family acetyltransferase